MGQSITLKDTIQPDWNPRSEAVLGNPHAAYDEMRKQCPVAYSDLLRWSLFQHHKGLQENLVSLYFTKTMVGDTGFGPVTSCL